MCWCVCVWGAGWLVLCFGKKALSFLEVIGLSGKEQSRLNRASSRLSVKISTHSTFTRNEKQLNMLWALKCDSSSDRWSCSRTEVQALAVYTTLSLPMTHWHLGIHKEKKTSSVPHYPTLCVYSNIPFVILLFLFIPVEEPVIHCFICVRQRKRSRVREGTQGRPTPPGALPQHLLHVFLAIYEVLHS